MNIADEIVWLAVAAGRVACRRKVIPTTEAELFAFTKGALEHHIQTVCDALTGVEGVERVTATVAGCNVCGQPLHMGCCNPERPVRFVLDGEGRAVQAGAIIAKPDRAIVDHGDGRYSLREGEVLRPITHAEASRLFRSQFDALKEPPVVIGIADTTGDDFVMTFPEHCSACDALLRGDHKNGERCPECGVPVVLV